MQDVRALYRQERAGSCCHPLISQVFRQRVRMQGLGPLILKVNNQNMPAPPQKCYDKRFAPNMTRCFQSVRLPNFHLALMAVKFEDSTPRPSADYRPKMTPAKMAAPTVAMPYVRPASSNILVAAELVELPDSALAVAVLLPPKPVYTTPSDTVDAAPRAVELEVVAGMVEIVLVLTLVGFVAPQGWSCMQAAAQVLSCPQAS